MARDTKDVKTVDAFPAKKRGRPSSGSAKTAAQRMAEKRERDRSAINRARTLKDYSALGNAALLTALGEAVLDENSRVARVIADLLVDRAKFGVTVTKNASAKLKPEVLRMKPRSTTENIKLTEALMKRCQANDLIRGSKKSKELL